VTQGMVVADCSFDDILDDPGYFKELLYESKLLCFPELNLSREQNKQVCAALGYVFDRQGDETHARTMDRKDWPNTSNKVLVQWHLENLDHEQPPLLAGWNMETFTCPKGHGRTGFIDMAKMCKKLKVDRSFEYVFIRSATEAEQLEEQMAAGKREFYINNTENTESIFTIATEGIVEYAPPQRYDSDTGYSPPIMDSVSPHPITGEPVLRYMVDSFHVKWLPVPDMMTEKQLLDEKLSEAIADFDNQFWWDWTVGDYLLVDLFCMQHSVLGGFTPEQRVLDVVFSTEAVSP